jgi:putative transposase
MPNYIHLIWQQNKLNGKETPKGNLLKHTAHLFQKQLKKNDTSKYYEANEANKKHEIWQRDSLGIEIYSREVAKQKIDYIHFNVVSAKWMLTKDDLGYHFCTKGFLKVA